MKNDKSNYKKRKGASSQWKNIYNSQKKLSRLDIDIAIEYTKNDNIDKIYDGFYYRHKDNPYPNSNKFWMGQENGRLSDIDEYKSFLDKTLDLRKKCLNQMPFTENIFAELLSICGIKFERQYPISLFDRFIYADFYIPKGNVVIELDGLYHYFKDNQAEKDKERDKLLFILGYNTYRFDDDVVTTYGIQIIERLSNIYGWNVQYKYYVDCLEMLENYVYDL